MRIIFFVLKHLWRSGRSVRVLLMATATLQLAVLALSLAVPYLLNRLIQTLSEGRPASQVMFWTLSYAALWAASEMLTRVESWAIVSATERAQRLALSNYVATQLSKPLAALLEIHSAETVARFSQLENAFPKIVNGLLFQIVPMIVRVTAVSILTTTAFGWEYGACFVACLCLYLLSTIIASRKTIDLQTQQFAQTRRVSTRIADVMRNSSLVKTTSNEAFEAKSIDDALTQAERLTVKLVGKLQGISCLQIMVIALGLLAVSTLGARSVMAGTINAGGFVQLNAYLLQFTLPASYFGYVVLETQRSLRAVADVLGSDELHPSHAEQRPLSLKGAPSIMFRHVSHRYHGAAVGLTDIDLSVAAGSTLAIVGPSGSGKSTLLKLLLGVYAPQNGEIRVNDEAFELGLRDAWLKNIGYVTQDAPILDRSLEENLLYGSGRLGQPHDADCLARLIDQVALGDVVANLKQGMATPLGEGGNRLSGGERQRVALARALAAQKHLLLLDEPTAALDALTERTVMRNLAAARVDATWIIVAHRLASIAHADQIVVMQAGRIVERGPHRALLNAGGIYAAMWDAQSTQRATIG